MENRNNAQINPAGYLAKGNGKINLLSPKMKIRYKKGGKLAFYESQIHKTNNNNTQASEWSLESRGNKQEIRNKSCRMGR